MKVHRELDNLPGFKKAVITIGTFDGVHLAHRQIIDQLKKEAITIGGETIIITFYPHPRIVVAQDQDAIKILTTIDEKTELLQLEGIDHLVIVPFNTAFSQQSAIDYIQNFLFKCFQPHTIVIGYDHKFGKNRLGDYLLLEEQGKILGFYVKEIERKALHHIVISSTTIRKSLNEGAIATANDLLGYTYFFGGLVMEGNKLGRTIGFPTANIKINDEEKLIPGNGVYAVKISIDKFPDKLFEGMMNIGMRPTVEGKALTIEVNIFNFEENIYARIVKVYVHHFIREEIKFASLERLKQQLEKDKQEVHHLFKIGILRH